MLLSNHPLKGVSGKILISFIRGFNEKSGREASLIYDLIIIGGGAAGLFAGANAPKGRILLLEKMDIVGKKMLISGGGMCNLTNKDDPDQFVQAFGSRKKANFLKPSLFELSPDKTVHWFEQRGFPLVAREDGKVFPEDLKARSLVDFLLAETKKHNVEVRTSQSIISVEHDKNSFQLKTDDLSFRSRYVLFATGGKSYPSTGSDGSAYVIVKSLGHKLIDPVQALSAVYIDSYDLKSLSGNSLKNISIDFYHKGENKRYHQSVGDLLFTHNGFSGPVILNNSRFIRNQDRLDLSLISGENRDFLREMILNEWKKQGAKKVRTFLRTLGIFSALSDIILEKTGIIKDSTCKSINGRKRNQLINLLLHYPVSVQRKGSFASAMVTAGGVALDYINRKTFESRIVPGLYFAGEILDLDGDTGGYNIQAAFSTSLAAIRDVSLKLDREDQ